MRTTKLRAHSTPQNSALAAGTHLHGRDLRRKFLVEQYRVLVLPFFIALDQHLLPKRQRVRQSTTTEEATRACGLQTHNFQRQKGSLRKWHYQHQEQHFLHDYNSISTVEHWKQRPSGSHVYIVFLCTCHVTTGILAAPRQPPSPRGRARSLCGTVHYQTAGIGVQETVLRQYLHRVLRQVKVVQRS